MRFRFALALLLLATPVFSADPPKLRLPGDARPLHYDVDLTLVPGSKVFQGTIQIDIEFARPTAELWLNANDLEIQTSGWTQNGKTTKLTAELAGKQFAGFAFPAPVSGKGRLQVSYTGKVINNSTAGVFELKDNGTPYLFSQFEATDARRAFPCFDEPSYKVPWQLTLHTRKSDGAFANTPQLSVKDEANGMKAVRFAPTKPLPSYLVAFAVGPFDVVDAGKLGKTQLRVITPKGRSGEAKYAVAAIPALLKLLEEYFGSSYPFEKLDSVSLPVSNLAMENPGLITYPQSTLLSSPEKDTIDRQREFAVVAAHEMAHQWFGDLVTTAWWDDIWLNEAFASWMESKIVQKWKPDWHMEIVAEKEKQGAMRQDSLVSARQIRQPIHSDDDIANAFDSITYLKGSAVINMFEKLVGTVKFRQGVRIYMKRYANGNTTTPQFLAAISEAAGRDVAPAFNTFLDRAGIPLVSMELHCDGAQPKVSVSQKRYLPLGSPGAFNAATTWQVPLCLKYDAAGSPVTQCDLMTDPRTEIALKSAKGCPSWIAGNAEGSGYYRVAYKGDLMDKVFENNGAHLSATEKVTELNNALAQVNAGDLAPAKALALVPIFAKDPQREVITSAAAIAEFVRAPYLSSELQEKGYHFVRETFGNLADSLGWTPKPGESEDTRLLRQDIVPMVAMAGDEKLIAEAKTLAEKWLVNRAAVDPNLTNGVLRTAARFGDEAFFDQLLQAVRKENESRSRLDIFSAMGGFKSRAIQLKAKALLLRNEFDANEAFFPLLMGGRTFAETREMPFEFVRTNIDALEKSLPRVVGQDLAAYLPIAGGSFCDEKSRDELKVFFEPRAKNYSGGPRLLAQTLESIDLCIGTRKALEPSIAQFLSKY